MAEYAANGYALTLLQLYYQFVVRLWIANRQSEYKRLGDLVSNGRLAGLIDWDHLVDRTRGAESNSHWSAPGSIISSAAESYQIDKWHGQKHRPEVWVEKQALEDIVERVCTELDVTWLCCRGYNSHSEMWRGAMRLKRYCQDHHQVPVILHLGDHDPSGLDMTRDIRDRVKLFCGFEVQVKRIALNWDQVQTYNPPPNPTKTTDSRAADYIRQFGNESWELDALEPQVLTGLIRGAVSELIDQDLFDSLKAEEDHSRRQLRKAARRWPEIVKLLKKP